MKTVKDLMGIAKTIRRRGLPDDVEAHQLIEDSCHVVLDGRQSVGLRLAAAEVVAAAMQNLVK